MYLLLVLMLLLYNKHPVGLEIFLMGQNRPLRSIHRGEGWSPETIAEHAIPAFKPNFYSLDRSQDIWPWDPV